MKSKYTKILIAVVILVACLSTFVFTGCGAIKAPENVKDAVTGANKAWDEATNKKAVDTLTLTSLNTAIGTLLSVDAGAKIQFTREYIMDKKAKAVSKARLKINVSEIKVTLNDSPLFPLLKTLLKIDIKALVASLPNATIDLVIEYDVEKEKQFTLEFHADTEGLAIEGGVPDTNPANVKNEISRKQLTDISPALERFLMNFIDDMTVFKFSENAGYDAATGKYTDSKFNPLASFKDIIKLGNDMLIAMGDKIVKEGMDITIWDLLDDLLGPLDDDAPASGIIDELLTMKQSTMEANFAADKKAKAYVIKSFSTVTEATAHMDKAKAEQVVNGVTGADGLLKIFGVDVKDFKAIIDMIVPEVTKGGLTINANFKTEGSFEFGTVKVKGGKIVDAK